MRRLATLVVGMAALSSAAHAAPLGPLRVVGVRDGLDHSGLINGLAVDGPGRVYVVMYGPEGPRFASTDGRRALRATDLPVEPTYYTDVLDMPDGAVLAVSGGKATIVSGDTRLSLSDAPYATLFTPVPGPLGAWAWTFSGAGSGLTLIRSTGRVIRSPFAFDSSVRGNVIASDKHRVWLSLSTAGGEKLARADAAGLHQVRRLKAAGQGVVDRKGRLYVVRDSDGSLLRVSLSGHTKNLGWLPAELRTHMAIDRRGTIWIGDYEHARILRIARDGARRMISVGDRSQGGVERVLVRGSDVWFRTPRLVGRLVTARDVCVVPDVHGLSARRARALVRAAGCRPAGARTGRYIVGQLPGDGKVVRAGAPVHLAKGRRDALRTPVACDISRNTSVAARGRDVLVAFQSVPLGYGDTRDTWTACHPQSGRRTVLLRAREDTLAGFEVAFAFAFQDSAVAFAVSYSFRDGATIEMRLVDAASGRLRAKASIASDESYDFRTPVIRDVLVRPSAVVYLVRDPVVKRTSDGAILPSFDRLAVLTAKGQTVLDESGPDEITNVRTDGSTVRWAHEGEAREAPLG
jgi:hypothetical protein